MSNKSANNETKEFEEKLLEVRKVTKVTTWWRRLAFRATILIWNRNWKIWVWVAKWPDVTVAIKKAVHDAYKKIAKVPVTKEWSIIYPITNKYKSSVIKFLPAASGTWIKAWSSVRTVLELAWYQNILLKIVWSNNKLNNALWTIDAMKSFVIKDSHAKYFIDPESSITENTEWDNSDKDNSDSSKTTDHISEKSSKSTDKKDYSSNSKSPKKTNKEAKPIDDTTNDDKNTSPKKIQETSQNKKTTDNTILTQDNKKNDTNNTTNNISQDDT